MARFGNLKCGCEVTVYDNDRAIPHAKLDFCPLHKHAARLRKASRQLFLVIHEQIPETTTSKEFQEALDRFWRALNASMEKAKR